MDFRRLEIFSLLLFYLSTGQTTPYSILMAIERTCYLVLPGSSGGSGSPLDVVALFSVDLALPVGSDGGGGSPPVDVAFSDPPVDVHPSLDFCLFLILLYAFFNL